MTAWKLHRGAELDLWKMIEDSNISQADPKFIKERIPNFIEEITQKDAILAHAFQRIHVINRINHRKLFWVGTPNGKEACFMIGGRNLGDHYLNWQVTKDNFVDGEILYCTHHFKNGDEDPVQAAANSFKDLQENLKDPIKDNIIYQLEKNDDFIFELLELENAPFYAPQIKQNLISSKLEQKDRLIPNIDILQIYDQATKGQDLIDAYNFRIRLASWDPSKDMIRKELLDGIDREQQEIYIETAYSEFNEDIKTRLENALKRGVNVHIVSNSFLVLDSASKIIRLTMAAWIKEMTEKYGKNSQAGKFLFEVATMHSGHMIHFKGFGFRCQKTENGYKKTFSVGSHNFHPRSGYSDKEHAILWDEPISQACADLIEVKAPNRLNKKDFIDLRKDTYQKLSVNLNSKLAGKPFLKNYLSLFDELSDEINALIDLKENDDSNTFDYESLINTGKSLKSTLFYEDGALKGGENTSKIMQALREGGLQDIFGIIL